MDLSNIILGGGGQGKQLARTTPDQVTGLQAVSSEEGILLSVDQPTEESYEYLKDYWVTFKLASEGEIQHPYDGEHIIFAKPTYTGNFEFLIPNAELIMDETYNIRIFPRNPYSQFQTAIDGSTAQVQTGVRTMTAVINLGNSDPSSSVTYADDAVNMTPGSSNWDEFFGIYPCLFKNGAEVGKLNPNDFSKMADGSSADITSGSAGDVMIAFPRRGIKITTSGTTLTVSMTDNTNAAGYSYLAHQRGSEDRNIFYLGAYKGVVESGKLRSLSGKTPTTNLALAAFRSNAQANGSGYEESAFYQLVFRQVMYILKYKNLNSQAAVGVGAVNGTGPTITGGTNTKGMDYGETTGNLQMKLFGLEDFWGNVYEWIDGAYYETNRHILTATDSFNDGGSGYTDHGQGAAADIGSYMTVPQGTSETGFIVKTGNGSSSTYFCDYSALYAGTAASFGGNWGTTQEAGAFLLYFRYHPSQRDVYTSGRLMYL